VHVHLPGSSLTWPSNASVLDGVAAFYSSLPLVIFVLEVIALLLIRGLREFVLLAFMPIFLFMTFFLKKLIRQPRPYGSCLTSCGMPSGHSIMSIGIAVFLLLELFTRSLQKSRQSRTTLYIFTGFIVVLLFPVPWSRVQLHDHSVAQVLVGTAVGVVVGVLYFIALRRWLAPRAAHVADMMRLYENYTPTVHTQSPLGKEF